MSPVLSIESAPTVTVPTAEPVAPARTPIRPANKVLYVAAGVVAVAGIGAGLALPGSTAHAVSGSVQLWQATPAGVDGAPCTGRGMDADITVGAPVRIKDAGGKLLATATLGAGRSDGAACVFSFTAPHVPRSGGYRIAAGDVSRPSNAYTFRDMRIEAWDVRVVIGA